MNIPAIPAPSAPLDAGRGSKLFANAGKVPRYAGIQECPGSGAVVAHLLWGQAVGGSNPPSPTKRHAGVVQR